MNEYINSLLIPPRICVISLPLYQSKILGLLILSTITGLDHMDSSSEIHKAALLNKFLNKARILKIKILLLFDNPIS